MRKNIVVKGRSLLGTTDLTLLAPIRSGFVPSMDSVTYKTRLKRVLETLHTLRISSHEYSLLRTFSDAVERVGKIHAVRVVVFEEENQVLLSATFDGAWESYIRVLWQKVGTLLDIIFCNTEGYVTSFDHTYAEWAAWARGVQRETPFFYGPPGVTVDDVRYLQQTDALRSGAGDGNAGALAAVRHHVPSVEQGVANAAGPQALGVLSELGRQGVQAAASLYRLSGLYMPGTRDGEVLHRAARELLVEFIQREAHPVVAGSIVEGNKRFSEALAWLFTPVPARHVPELPTSLPTGLGIQGGILKPYERITHGCLLLLAFDSPKAAAHLLQDQAVTSDSDPHGGADTLFTNLALTLEGLRALGLGDAQLEKLPQDFREGMAARASTLGDVRWNHPRRWRLPRRNWPAPEPARAGRPAPAHQADHADQAAHTSRATHSTDAQQSATAPAAGALLDLGAVHAVLQWRIGGGAADVFEASDPRHPLHARIHGLIDAHPGVRLLAVESMVRYRKGGDIVEHFGYADGNGQPLFDPAVTSTRQHPNLAHLGELLVGRENQADAAQAPALPWLADGSFLVLRKLRQDVGAMDEAVRTAAAATDVEEETIRAKLMGRGRDGLPLVGPGGADKNDFDYTGDPAGTACPLHAHIRRAHPRTPPGSEPLPQPGARTPRIVRRGMSYGPPHHLVPEADRGMLFMAYNASIAEQFELVQRWLSGGNSTGGHSAQSDPLLGVPEPGKRREFRFEHNGVAHSMQLDGADNPMADPKPLVRLEWGLYLFAPSIAGLQMLAQAAQQAAQASEPAWSVEEGEHHVQALLKLPDDQALEGWKIALEDPEARKSLLSASIWAAIRKLHGGVLATPYGVLVADAATVMQVFEDPLQRYSVSGYMDRMEASIGPIHLGLNRSKAGDAYDQASMVTNHAITALSARRGEVFRFVRAQAVAEIERLVVDEQALALRMRRTLWELSLPIKEISDKVLEHLCHQWFGLDDAELKPGAWNWAWKPGDPPLYPGHFTAPSRYIFQPHPGPEVERLGVLVGVALRDAMRRFVTRVRLQPLGLPLRADNEPAEVAKAIFADSPGDDDLTARNMVGALMGFLPTVDGSVQLVFDQWLRDGSYGALRAELAASTETDPLARARKTFALPLARAMQWRPSPELVWRTARVGHELGDKAKVPVRAGDKVVLAIVSATHQRLAEGVSDASGLAPIFGGLRNGSGHAGAPMPVQATHACPGYGAAKEVMLGIASALLEIRHHVRVHPAPLVLSLEGPVDLPLNSPVKSAVDSPAASPANLPSAEPAQG